MTAAGSDRSAGTGSRSRSALDLRPCKTPAGGNGEQDWIFSIAQVVEEKAWHCNEVPSPLQMERRMRGEVLP